MRPHIYYTNNAAGNVEGGNEDLNRHLKLSYIMQWLSI